MSKTINEDTLMSPMLVEKLIAEKLGEALASYYTKTEADAKFQPKSN